MSEILIPIVLFLSIFGIVYVYLMTRNKERLSMIEKGIDLSQLHSNNGNPSPLKYWVIKVGFLMIGIALGIIVGSMASKSFLNEEEAYPSMVLLFGGMSLIASYFVEKKLRENAK